MNEKDKSTFNSQYHVRTITFIIGIIIVTGILFVGTSILNQNHDAIAQQQLQEQALASKDISFDIDNVTPVSLVVLILVNNILTC